MDQPHDNHPLIRKKFHHVFERTGTAVRFVKKNDQG